MKNSKFNSSGTCVNTDFNKLCHIIKQVGSIFKQLKEKIYIYILIHTHVYIYKLWAVL